MTATPTELARDVIARCRGLGFADAGVCEAAPSSHRREYREWIEAGKMGEMGYLARNVEERLDPRVMMVPGGRGARSIIVVADQYALRGSSDDGAKPGMGRIARYAQGDDYHEVMKQRLHALCDGLRAEHVGHEFRAFVDTAPVLEREHAVRAGLGWIGKHTLLIHPKRGSWFFLGGVLTTLELAPPPEMAVITDHCGTCTRCIDACPTGAITPHSVDARRCISYLTIEHRSEIEPEFRGAMGDWLYGCDVCQEVCPHNSERDAGVEVGEVNPAYKARRRGFDVLEVLGWGEDDRRRAFTKSAMKRAKLDMMKRNAGIVRENQLKGSGSAPAM